MMVLKKYKGSYVYRGGRAQLANSFVLITSQVHFTLNCKHIISSCFITLNIMDASSIVSIKFVLKYTECSDSVFLTTDCEPVA